MASQGRSEPRCSAYIADKIVTLLKSDEEARNRWNTLLGRGIGAAMRDTFMSFNRGRRGEYTHNSATRALNARAPMDGAIRNHVKFCAAVSRGRIVS